MSDSLIPCTACARHVRASAPSCPFCDAPVTAAPACASDIDDALARGHSAARAGVLAAVTLAAGFSLAACYGGPPRPPTYRPSTPDSQQQQQQPAQPQRPIEPAQ